MSDKYTPEFREWWKNHRHAGFCEDRFGKAHWGVYPSEAWKHDCYRTEYSIAVDLYYDRQQEYSVEEIDKWAKEQMEADAFAEKHGFTFSCEENKSIALRLIKESSLTERVKAALDGKGKGMREKIDEVYAYEPGQSKEETRLLARRRDYTKCDGNHAEPPCHDPECWLIQNDIL